MKYLIPLILILNSCNTVTSVEHPIDEEKQETLLMSESPVLTVNLMNISIMASILAILMFFIWYIGWKKNQNKVEVEVDST